MPKDVGHQKDTYIVMVVVAILVIASLAVVWVMGPTSPKTTQSAVASSTITIATSTLPSATSTVAVTPEEKLARCLTAKGVKMYGTAFCSHCQNQKRRFGDDFKYINYIECTANASECLKQNINGFPTWTFADGPSQEGEMELKDLAAKAGCVYPK